MQLRRPRSCLVGCSKGKSIISKVRELFSSPGPQFGAAPPPPPFITWAHVSIAGSQIINDRLNLLSMF